MLYKLPKFNFSIYFSQHGQDEKNSTSRKNSLIFISTLDVA